MSSFFATWGYVYFAFERIRYCFCHTINGLTFCDILVLDVGFVLAFSLKMKNIDPPTHEETNHANLRIIANLIPFWIIKDVLGNYFTKEEETQF